MLANHPAIVIGVALLLILAVAAGVMKEVYKRRHTLGLPGTDEYDQPPSPPNSDHERLRYSTPTYHYSSSWVSHEN